MNHRRALLFLPLTLLLLQCRTAAVGPQPLRLVGLTRSDDSTSVAVPLEPLRNGTAWVDEHLHGFVATTTSNFEVALRSRWDTGLSRVYWEYGIYTDAAGIEHRSLTPMFNSVLNPTPIVTDYQRFYFAPTEFTTVIPCTACYRAETRFHPFLEDLPPNARVQLQLPMDLDGKRVTYTFTFAPAT